MLNKLTFIARVVLRDRAATRHERGATATEYGLLVGFIAMVIIAGVFLFGEGLDAYYSNLANAVTGF